MLKDRPTILILGKSGQIGWELCRTMSALGDMMALDYPEVDLGKPDSLREAIRSVKPDIMINAAAYTAVDKAESEPQLAMTINAVAPGIIAEEAKKLGAVLVHYSTDYVYDGNKTVPYVETDTTGPLNTYGKTKLAGDTAIDAVGVPHFIFRTSWVYGWRGHNFLLTMLKLSREKDELKVVDDQTGAPTWSRTIAEATAQIISQGIRDPKDFFKRNNGLYHMTAAGCGSWYEFAKNIFECDPNRNEQKLRRLLPISTAEFATAAARPRSSILNNLKLFRTFGIKLPDWRLPISLWSQLS